MRATDTTALIALVLALGVSVTTCRLDKLINPATADRLVVNRDSILASARVRSLVPETTTVRVASADGVTLPWTATKTATWVTLLPSPESLVVMLHADTVLQTLWDTIVFTSPQSTATVRVPVQFVMLPPAADLSLSDTARAYTAFVRSAQPDTFRLRIKNTGGLSLDWTAVLDAAWVTLSDSAGAVPAQDTTSTNVLVTLRPESLSTGTHNARIIFADSSAIGSPDTVRLTYTIAPCTETLIPTLDAVVSSAIALNDCGAPQRAGRQAKLYTVQVAAGDTLSVRLTGAFDAYLVLTDSFGTSLRQNNDCAGPAGPACILEYPVTTTGRYIIEATTAAAGETGAFSLSAVRERAPSAPAAGQFRVNGTTAIGVGAVTPENTVVFKATLNDPNPSDSVRLQIEVVGLATGTLIDSSASVPRGTPVALPVSGLNENEGYYWRARTCDKTGRCSAPFSFGGNVDPAADFFINAVQEDPALTALGQFGPGGGAMAVGGGTGGTLGNNVTVTFKASVTDPDPGDLISIEVEWKPTGTAFNGTTNITRGNGVASSDTAAVAVSFSVGLLTANYHWRARACDQANRCSVFGPFGGNTDPNDVDFHVP